MRTGNEISPVYELKDTSKVKELFIGWQETLVYSCLQHVMGKIYVTDTEKPESAFAFVGCFGFFAGRPDRELVVRKPDGFVIMVPQDEAWSALIEECYPSAKKVKRFAIKKDTIFDTEMLRKEISKLPPEYELRQIDADLYDQCLENPVTADFVSAFESKEQYLKIGRGMVILKDGKIVSGASSYTRYNEGIEIEVDTIEPERRKHLATIACSALILKCLDEGLYPSWDAQNMHSVRLAEKLGYEFDHAYTAYEVAAEVQKINRLSSVTVKNCTAENKEKAFIGDAEMDNGILFFFGEHMDALPIYERLEERILAQVPDVKIKIAKTQITFAKRYGFAFVSFNPCRRAKDRPAVWMTVTFGLGYRKESPRIDVATEPYPGRWTHHVMVGTPDEIDEELLGWIKEAAEFSAAKKR